MKRILVYLVLGLSVGSEIACQRADQTMKDGNDPTTFPTAQEAAARARQDLVSLLRTQPSLNLGLDLASMESAQPGPPVPSYQVTFESLLQASELTALRGHQLGTFVPLVAGNNLVTAVQVARRGEGWSVVSLGEKAIADDLAALRRAAPGPVDGVVIYSLPHSGAQLYEVGGLVHTRYPGFSLEQGVPPDAILPVLKRDAAEFQRVHGDALKAKKLVN